MAGTNGHRPNVSVDSIAEQYLWCRSVQHEWHAHDVDVTRTEYRVETRCARCSTHRVQVLDKRGYILPGRSFYVYPEQQVGSDAAPYLIKGLGRLDVSDRARLRVLSIKQITKQKGQPK